MKATIKPQSRAKKPEGDLAPPVVRGGCFASRIDSPGSFAIGLPPADLGGPFCLFAFRKNGNPRKVFTVPESLRFPCEESAAIFLDLVRWSIPRAGLPLVVNLEHFKLPESREEEAA